MIRILHVIGGLKTGGAELFLGRLIQSLAEGEFKHQVVSLSGVGPVGEKLRRSGVRVDDLRLERCFGVVPSLVKLSLSFRKVRPDLVQCWLYHGNIAAALAVRMSGIRCPLLWNIRHSLDQWSEEKFFLRGEIRLGGWLARMPERVIFNSVHSAQQHERLGYPRSKAYIVPNGFDVGRFAPNAMAREAIRKRLGFRGDDVVVGMVGRFHPLKDHANFLYAVRKVVDESSIARFVLVGREVTSGNSELMRLIHELGLEGQIQMLGERNDIPNLMNAFDIYVSSSSSEAFPNAVGEAMSCGVPCVVTDAGDSAELVGDTGIVVPVKSPEQLAAGILELIRVGAGKRRALGESARERIQVNYSMERVAQQYADLYRSVFERETSRRS